MSIEKNSRLHPYTSHILNRSRLNHTASTKKTFHISLAISNTDFPYQVGDSIGIFIQNDPEEVNAILKLLGKKWDDSILDPKTNLKIAIGDYLLTKANLTRVSTSFFKSLIPHEKDLFLTENKEALTKVLNTHTLLDLLTVFTTDEAINVTQLMPLLPRFYSIANSPEFFPNEIHLTISYLTYVINGKERHGIASKYLCDLAIEKETPISVYLQPSLHFHLPTNPNSSMIMVGPGTGVAPFRAFLQDRIAKQQEGKNWLFFGERNKAYDFYYGDFFTDLEKEGRLRLNLAFSRDGKEKTYVQHEMLKEKKSLWEWLNQGALFYVCGDAAEMAKDVDKALHQVVQECGGYTEEESRKYIKQLRLEKRYLTDVY